MGVSLLMSPSCRFPAGHMAVEDNADLKEVLLLKPCQLHFQNLLFLKKINKYIKISQGNHYYGPLSFEGEIMFHDGHNLYFRII